MTNLPDGAGVLGHRHSELSLEEWQTEVLAELEPLKDREVRLVHQVHLAVVQDALHAELCRSDQQLLHRAAVDLLETLELAHLL